MKIAVVGGGWAGCAAAVEAAAGGADVTLWEATPTLGGRARALMVPDPHGPALTLDNGQHILIGAYTETLACLQRVGVDLASAFWPLPLALPFPDGTGLQTPAWATRWPAPLDALAAIATTRGWSLREKAAILRRCLGWQRRGFCAEPQQTVSELCAGLPERVMAEMIEPLCVSALNLPSGQASAAVFLRVLKDALTGPGFGGWRPSSLLLPRQDLSALWPEAAARWLQTQYPQHARVITSARVRSLHPAPDTQGRPGWRLLGEHQGQPLEARYDAVIWATGASAAAQVMRAAADTLWAPTPLTDPAPGDANARHTLAAALASWASVAGALPFTAITTVYARAPGWVLPHPMLALRAEPDAHTAPAQFVFDRGQLQAHDPATQGVLAFVVSASEGTREDLQQRVIDQGLRQLAPLGLRALQPLQTVVEKRATFACLPGLLRPGAQIAAGLWAAGDAVQGPYPATLEAAVRSGLAAARGVLQGHPGQGHTPHTAPDQRPETPTAATRADTGGHKR